MRFSFLVAQIRSQSGRDLTSAWRLARDDMKDKLHHLSIMVRYLGPARVLSGDERRLFWFCRQPCYLRRLLPSAPRIEATSVHERVCCTGKLSQLKE